MNIPSKIQDLMKAEELAGIEPGYSVSCKVVAVVFTNGEWAAFAGSMDQSDETVILIGQRLKEQSARDLFYGLDKSGRRYDTEK